MPRPQNTAEAEVLSALRSYSGEDIHYPATLSTLYAVRNAVYRYNRESGKKFKCVIQDDGVVLTMRAGKSNHDAAAKEIKNVLTAAKLANENSENMISAKVIEVIHNYFGENSDSENEDDETDLETAGNGDDEDVSEDFTPERVRRKNRK